MTAAEHELEAEAHARALEKCCWPEFPRLTDDDRERVHKRIDELAEAHAIRVAEYRRTLWRLARRLGRNVAHHKITLDAATRQLELAAERTDAQSPVPIALIPYDEARKIIRSAFAAGYREDRQ